MLILVNIHYYGKKNNSKLFANEIINLKIVDKIS